MRKDVRNEIIRIGGDNINKSEMARIMGCSRQTIYNHEERLKNPKPKKEVIRTSKLDPFKEIIDTKCPRYCFMMIATKLKKQTPIDIDPKSPNKNQPLLSFPNFEIT